MLTSLQQDEKQKKKSFVQRTHGEKEDTYQRLFRKVLDLDWHGGREQDHLSLMFEVIHSVPDILFEPRINHSIGFIQH